MDNSLSGYARGSAGGLLAVADVFDHRRLSIFVVTWIIALGVWHFGNLEEKWDVASAKTNSGE